MSEAQGQDNPRLGISFILLAMLCITVNDLLMKMLSGSYPLHEMVFVRSVIGITASLAILQFEGGFARLRTSRPGLHLLRGLAIVVANTTFFAALAVLPLGDATALFFVAPLFITLLSIPFLGERVGLHRFAALVVGFAGVLVMLRPGTALPDELPSRGVLLLPMLAAFAYACMQILTRRLGVSAPASVLAVYIQATFLVVSGLFWLVAGDGRFAEGLEDPSLVFLLRAWVVPPPADWPLFALLGGVSAVIGYALSQAYRSARAATVAPFEYVALPLSIFWGWLVFGDLPDAVTFAGIALIAAAGIYVFVREGRRNRQVASGRPVRRV